MRVTIPYGMDFFEFNLPDEYFHEIYSPNPVDRLEDPRLEIEKSIENPIGSPPLKDIVFNGCRVCIICDDIARPTPTDLILELLKDGK